LTPLYGTTKVVRFHDEGEAGSDMTGKQASTRREQATRVRKDHEPPTAISTWGWRYHHLGIPTHTPRPGESYLEQFKMYVSGFETSPYGIEWMRFEPDSPVAALIRSVPHIAFEVDDLEAALEGKQILAPASSPSKGVRVAMILDNGAPVELLEFRSAARAEGGDA
jgi:hypothetical protein